MKLACVQFLGDVTTDVIMVGRNFFLKLNISRCVCVVTAWFLGCFSNFWFLILFWET